MKTCKTCDYWIAVDKVGGFGEEVECLNKNGSFEVRKCKDPRQEIGRPPENIHSYSLASTDDGIPMLLTAENFGCVNHSDYEKEKL